MSYAIIGAGKEGQALAKAFTRKGVEVAIASRQSAEALAPVAKANRDLRRLCSAFGSTATCRGIATLIAIWREVYRRAQLLIVDGRKIISTPSH